MRELLRVILGLFILGVLLVWVLAQIDYRITETHLEVTLLGMRLRRIRLADIRYVNRRRTGLCERWPNTLFPGRRVLVIHRRSGLLKNFVITPRNRYIFKAALERALGRSR